MTDYNPTAPFPGQGQGVNPMQLLQQMLPQQIAAYRQLPGIYAQQQGALADMAKLYQQPQGGPDTALLQLAQGFLAPTRTGGFGENLGMAVGNYAGALTQQRAAELDRAQKLAQLKMTQAQLASKLPEAQLDAMKSIAGTASSMESLSEKGRLVEERNAQNKALNDLIKSGQVSPEIARILPTMPADERSKFLREVMKPKELSAGDKEAIRTADDLVQTNTDVIGSLKQAKDLSKNAYSGWLAGARGNIGANLGAVGEAVGIDTKRAGDTVRLDNKVTQNALQQLRAVFGGNPTEGEREILLKIQGSANMTQREREQVYDDAIAAAQKRLAENAQRSKELRSGTYYNPQRPSASAPVTNAPSTGPDASAVVQSARDAIAKGADRNAVIKRLKENGINPPGDL